MSCVSKKEYYQYAENGWRDIAREYRNGNEILCVKIQLEIKFQDLLILSL